MSGKNPGNLAAARPSRSPARKIFAGVALWTVFITVAHVAANVGFANLAEETRAWLGLERRSLRVGFLPVT